MEEKKNNYIGGLWIKVTNEGKQFMSGNIEIDGKKVNISCWVNDFKKDNQPDYRIKLNDYKKEEVKAVEVESSSDLPF